MSSMSATLLLLWLLTFGTTDIVGKEVSFRAAVAEFIPLLHLGNGETTLDYFQRVLKDYETLTEEAANRAADIVVFPEYGLTSTRILGLGLAEAQEWMQEIPSDDSDASDRTLVFRRLQTLARQNSIYVVANFATREKCDDTGCPKDVEYRFYNTQIALDRSGNLVSRYRKFNRYGEEHLFSQTTGGPDVAFFDTDFGARVGLFICFDLNFARPWNDLRENGVDVIAYSTAWVDELPFLTALQYHPGFARGHGITFLSSGYHRPSSGAMGSGIYGQSGILNYLLDNDLDRSTLVISDVILGGQARHVMEDPCMQKCPADTPFYMHETTDSSHFFLEQDLQLYSWHQMTPGPAATLTLTLDDLSSCVLHYHFEYDDEPQHSFAFVGYRGPRTFGGGVYVNGVDNCGVVFCATEGKNLTDLQTCGKVVQPGVKHSANFNRLQLVHKHPSDAVSMPLTLQMQMSPLESTAVTYENAMGKMTKLSLNTPIVDLYSFGLLARAFEFDKENKHT